MKLLVIVHRMYEFTERNQDQIVGRRVRRESERASATKKSPIRYKGRGRKRVVSGGVGDDN